MKKTYITLLTLLAIGSGLTAQNLSLDSCKYYALINNKKLKESRLELKASELVKRNAFTNYFPQIEAGALAMKAKSGLIEGQVPEMNLPVYDGNPMSLAAPTQFAYFPGMDIDMLDYTNAGFVMAVQPIYTGGRIINGNKLAQLGIDVRELIIEMTIDEVIQNTENYYWTIVSLQEKKKTLVSYEKLLNNLHADVNVAYEAGLIQKSDLLKVELELNGIEANKLKLDNGISILKMTLAQQMGIDYTDNYVVRDTVIAIEDPTSLFVTPNEALTNRVEYQLLNKSIRAEELQKKMARGEYMPQVAVGAQAFYLDMLDNETTNALGFAMVTVPLSGGEDRIKLKSMKLKLRLRKTTLKKSRSC
jgi:outer membrane protein